MWKPKAWMRLPRTVRRGVIGLIFAFGLSVIALEISYWAVRTLCSQEYAAESSQVAGKNTFGTIPVVSKVAPWTFTAERMIVFLDAVSAGIVAFALLGAFTFLFALRRPEEETVDDRVAFLYSSRREGSRAATQYLKDQVTLLGATVHEAKFTYTLLELAADGALVRVNSQVEMCLVNMMEHDTYRQKMPLRIRLGKLDGFKGDLGIVSQVTTTPCERNGAYGSPKKHLLTPFRFTNDNPTFYTEIDLEIPPGGSARYEYSWDAWNKASDENYCGANRFVERSVVKIINVTGGNYEVGPYQSDQRSLVTVGQAQALDDGATLEFEFTELPPTSDVAFFLQLK